MSAVAWLGQQLGEETGVSALRHDGVPLRADVGPAREIVLPGGDRRVFREVSLETGGSGSAEFTMSEPADRPAGPLPLVVILAGFQTGREALRLVPLHADAILVAYEYPYAAERWQTEPKWRQVPAAREAVLRVPAQVTAAKAWLRRRGRVDAGRTALLGFSFGAVFAPSVQAIAAEREQAFRAVGLAYGGAGIDRMVRRALNLTPSWLEPIAARAIAAAVSPVEPARHLPGLPGSFMLVHGREDGRIPAEASELATRLAPRPRRVVRLDTGHLHPSRRGLLRRVGELFRSWLAEEGILSGSDHRSGSARASPDSGPGGHRTRARSGLSADSGPVRPSRRARPPPPSRPSRR